MSVTLPPTHVTAPSITLAPIFVTPEEDIDFASGLVPPPGYFWVSEFGWTNQAEMEARWRVEKYEQGDWKSALNSALMAGKDVALEVLDTASKADAYIANGLASDVTLAVSLVTDKATEILGLEDMHELSGGVLSPVSALSNFVFGSAETMTTNINNLGLHFELEEFAPIQDAMQSAEQGVTQLVIEKIGYDTGNDSIITEAFLGNITLKVEGSITKSGDAVSFDGVVRAYNDVYDANLGGFRTEGAELATQVLKEIEEAFPAKPFEIQIVGEAPIHFDF